MANKLEWSPNNESVDYVIDPPLKGVNGVPKWYQNLSRFFDQDGNATERFSNDENGNGRLAIKNCAPYLDGFTTGYYVTLWCDIQVTKNEENQLLEWSSTIAPIETRGNKATQNVPIPSGYTSLVSAWVFPYVFRAPKGYSLLITHPFNRWDLPFITSSGIVESDVMQGAGRVPFHLDKNFDGVIKAGTPIAQIVPIKRDNWVIEKNTSLMKMSEITNVKLKNYLYGYYKKHFWIKKRYE
jgi:hypothetical protein